MIEIVGWTLVWLVLIAVMAAARRWMWCRRTGRPCSDRWILTGRRR